MHIIFGHVGNWHIPLITILKRFNFKIFYLFIESKSKFQKNKIATKLEKKNIFPLPFEFEKNISPKGSYSLMAEDIDEIAYKKNVKMISDKILEKYCYLFSIDAKEVKKLRLLIQDVICEQQLLLSAKIGLWSKLYPSEKIIFISFKLKSFFTPDVGHNIIKIVIRLYVVTI